MQNIFTCTLIQRIRARGYFGLILISATLLVSLDVKKSNLVYCMVVETLQKDLSILSIFAW